MNMPNDYALQRNNQAEIAGIVSGEFKFSHETFGEGFYETHVLVERISGTTDYVPIMVSDHLIDVSKQWDGKWIGVKGQFRSFNVRSGQRSRLKLFVFARQIDLNVESFENHLLLEGFICKDTSCRKTPLGREVSDVMLAVNRPYGRSDYLPCICWGRNALYAANMKVGTKLCMEGRIQSRNYFKTLENGDQVERTALEVSASKVKEVYDEADQITNAQD